MQERFHQPLKVVLPMNFKTLNYGLKNS